MYVQIRFNSIIHSGVREPIKLISQRSIYVEKQNNYHVLPNGTRTTIMRWVIYHHLRLELVVLRIFTCYAGTMSSHVFECVCKNIFTINVSSYSNFPANRLPYRAARQFLILLENFNKNAHANRHYYAVESFSADTKIRYFVALSTIFDPYTLSCRQRRLALYTSYLI